jgi:hypothetical protein
MLEFYPLEAQVVAVMVQQQQLVLLKVVLLVWPIQVVALAGQILNLQALFREVDRGLS